MVDHSPNFPKIVSERAYVVYEGESGQIVHVHEISVFEGAEEPHKGADQERALTMARAHGHQQAGLKVLAVRTEDVRAGIAHRVDPKTSRLIPLEKLPEKSR